MCSSNFFTTTTTHLVLSQSYCRQCCHRKLASSCSHALVSGTPMWFVVLRCTENPDSCGAASHGMGPGGSLAQNTENEHCFWFGMWTAEICTVLLAGVLGPEGVAVFQVKNMIILKFPHHAQRFALQVTTPAHPSCLSRLPWFSP